MAQQVAEVCWPALVELGLKEVGPLFPRLEPQLAQFSPVSVGSVSMGGVSFCDEWADADELWMVEASVIDWQRLAEPVSWSLVRCLVPH